MQTKKSLSAAEKVVAARVIIDNTTAEPVDQSNDDAAVLDELEKLAADCILVEDDGDEPGAKDEIQTYPVEKNLPRFANFRSNPATVLEFWGTTDRQGMDDLVYVTTKSFAPNFEDDVDLRRVRIYETVTPDGVIRLIHCFMPEADRRKPNLWTTNKLAALQLSLTTWTTMRSRKKLQQYTYRPSRKDYGEPKFSGLTKARLVGQLRDQGLLVVDENHPFYKKATDAEE
jgi:hypothetical protein